MIAQLLAKIGVDISDLNKAEVALKNFEHSFSSAFKRPPSGEMRAEAAVSGFVRQLSAGDIPGALESLTHRLGGMGVVGGVAFGVLVLGATKALEAAKELEKTYAALDEKLSTIPTAGMGIQALGELIQTQATKIGETAGRQLMAKMGERLASAPQSIMTFFNPFAPFGFDEEAEKKRDAMKAAVETLSVKQIGEALKEQAKARAQNAEIADAQARGDVTAVAYKKALVEYEKEQAGYAKERDALEKAMKEKILTPQESDQFAADKRRAKEISDAAADANKRTAESVGDRAARLAQEEVITTTAISQVKERGLSADVEKNQLAAINIQHLERQLEKQGDITESVRAQLKAQLDAAKALDEGEKKKTARAQLLPGFEAHSQLSLEELAKMPRRGWIGGAMDQQIVAAQRVQQLMAMSEKERLAGHPQQAFALFARAEEFKRGMPLLRESEKSPEMAFLTALNSATVFTSMVKYLGEIAAAVVGGNPFLNKS
jgi:hypothetical protein